MSDSASTPAAAPEFKDVFGKVGTEEFPAEAGRYHLYQHDVCPFAHRATVAVALAGLEDVVSVSRLAPAKVNNKWAFSEKYPDPHHPEFKSIVELYELGAPGYTGAHSVPVLFDTKTGKIVSNSSAEIAENLFTGFGDLGKFSTRRVVHDDQADAHKEAMTWLNQEIVFAPYKLLYAKSQEEYDAASQNFFGSPESPTGLHHLEKILSTSKFLTGDKFGLVDLFAYVVVYRLPVEFAVIFGANRHVLSDFPNLSQWVAAIRGLDGVASSQDHTLTRPLLLQWLQQVIPGSKYVQEFKHEPVFDLPAPADRVPFP